MNHHSRMIWPPGASRKRKETEAIQSPTSSKPLIPPTSVTRAVSLKTHETTSSKIAEPQPLSSNRLLAGYMAYEFLTKGTLLAQKFDPARSEALPVNAAAQVMWNRQSKLSKEAEPIGKSKPKPESYAELANLLKSDGVHIPGIVNPTQLSRWIEM